MSPAVITLLTDFGTADYFVGVMKGVILSICPGVQVVDISHEVPPQNIHHAAFTLLAAYESFPPETIHVAVVDPGVGSARRPIIGIAGGQFFVGPDNGIFSYAFERETDVQVIDVRNEEFFRRPVSETFHGRDVFAPVAAALAMRVEPTQFGERISDWVRLESISPAVAEDGTIAARIIHIDRFGNCITNLTREHTNAELITTGLKLIINGRKISSLRRFFGDEDAGAGELFAIWGSAGFLEVAAANASAAQVLDARAGQLIQVKMG